MMLLSAKKKGALSKLAAVILLALGGVGWARYVPPAYTPDLVEGQRIDLTQFDPIIPVASGGAISDIRTALVNAGAPSVLADAIALALSTAGEAAGIPDYPMRLSSFLSYECGHFGADNNIGAFFCAASNLYQTAYGYISNLGIRHANIVNRVYGDFLRQLGQSVYDAVVSAASGADWLKAAAEAMNNVKGWLDTTMTAYYRTIEGAGYAAVDAVIGAVFGPSDAQNVNYGEQPGTKLKDKVNTDEESPPENPAQGEAKAKDRIGEVAGTTTQLDAIGNTMALANSKAAQKTLEKAKQQAEASALQKAADDALRTAIALERSRIKPPMQLPGDPAKEMAERRTQLAAAVSDRQVLEIIGNILLSDGLYRRSEAEAILRALANQAELQAQTFKALAIVAKATATQFQQQVAQPTKEAIRGTYEATVQEAARTSANLRSVLCLQTIFDATGPLVDPADPSTANDRCAALYAPPDKTVIADKFKDYTNF